MNALVAAGWTFPGDDARSVARARARVRQALSPHVPAPVLTDAALAVSELAGNAIRHTRSGEAGGRYAVAAAVLPDRIRIAVVDQGAATSPRVATPEAMNDPTSCGGRGLGCLALLGAVGWQDVPCGRRVWADLPCGGAR